MIEITLSFALFAFLAGLLMFLAPCTLPLVPAYLAFISGVNSKEIIGNNLEEQAHKKIILNGLFFVLGFTSVFIIFGIVAGALGSYIGQWRGLFSQIGGIFIIIFGLMMLGVVKFTPLQKEYRLSLPKIVTPGQPSSSFLIGNIFALGWTPCVGPVLATIILLATDSATIISGAFMLGIFSVGLAIPFLLTAFLYGKAEPFIAKHSKISELVSTVGGLFMILIGILLLTGNFGWLVVYGYKLFEFMNYEAIYNYL